jgi:ferric-dicitrate binding protein FerR (iron transport regulator)
MPVDKTTVDQWLDRYFAAEASLEEETGLRAYYQSGRVHSSHQEWAPLFVWTDELANSRLPDGFEDHLLHRLGARSTPVRHLPWRRALAVAAGLALLVSAAWWLSRQTPDHGLTHLALEEDTYQDPEEAYAEFTTVLAMVAGALDQGRQITMESVAPAEGLDIFIIQ